MGGQFQRTTDPVAKSSDVPHDRSLASLAKKFRVNSASVSLKDGEVLILPSNDRITRKQLAFNAFAQTTKELMVVLRRAGIESRLYDDGREKRELILRYADIILPVLVFVGKAAAGAALGLLARWIYDRLIKSDQKFIPNVKAEYIQIEKDGTIVRWRKIEGPATEVCQLVAQEANLLSGQTQDAIPQTAVAEEGSWTRKRRESAQNALNEANGLIRQAGEVFRNQNPAEAEKLFRASLTKIREAALWEPENKSHKAFLHSLGRYVHDTFGCHFELRDGQYHVTCPVQLSHSRGGMSIGGAGKVLCSICFENILECPHEKGQSYDGIVARRQDGMCNICGRNECGHEEGQLYDGVELFGIVTDMDLDHVAFVENPADPLCVVHGYTLTKDDILAELPEKDRGHFHYGKTTLHCHHCLYCTGAG